MEMGSAPAPGVATRRPRRVNSRPPETLNDQSNVVGQEVAGEGAGQGTRASALPPHYFGTAKTLWLGTPGSPLAAGMPGVVGWPRTATRGVERVSMVWIWRGYGEELTGSA
jgi:hypothetical protein